MNKKLYVIENSGESTSTGLVRLTDEELNVIIEAFSNMNRYGLVPIFSIYEIEENDIREVSPREVKAEFWEDGYIDRDCLFNLDGKTYTWTERYFFPHCDSKLIFTTPARGFD